MMRCYLIDAIRVEVPNKNRIRYKVVVVFSCSVSVDFVTNCCECNGKNRLKIVEVEIIFDNVICKILHRNSNNL